MSDDGVRVYRLDLAYPHAKIAIEYDGEEFHTSERQRRRDEECREWLRRRGWYVIVVTKTSFGDESLRGWIDELRAVLIQRGVNF